MFYAAQYLLAIHSFRIYCLERLVDVTTAVFPAILPISVIEFWRN